MCEHMLDGEPVFLIRAQDILALEIVEKYYNLADVNKTRNLGRVRSVMKKMQEWRNENRDRVKVPD